MKMKREVLTLFVASLIPWSASAKWKFESHQDPMTDKGYEAMMSYADGVNGTSGKIPVIVGCTNSSIAYVRFNTNYVPYSAKPKFKYRLDKGNVKTIKILGDSKNDALFVRDPISIQTMLEDIKRGNNMLIAIDRDENFKTEFYSLSLKGSSAAASKIMKCNNLAARDYFKGIYLNAKSNYSTNQLIDGSKRKYSDVYVESFEGGDSYLYENLAAIHSISSGDGYKKISLGFEGVCKTLDGKVYVRPDYRVTTNNNGKVMLEYSTDGKSFEKITIPYSQYTPLVLSENDSTKFLADIVGKKSLHFKGRDSILNQDSKPKEWNVELTNFNKAYKDFKSRCDASGDGR